MTYGLLAIGFIFFVLFLLYKIIHFSIHLVINSFRRAKSPTRRSYYLNDDRFPVQTSPSYQISQNEFIRIANKTAYRQPRVENVEIKNNVVSIEFSSQSGLSRNHAEVTFVLSGVDVGKHSIVTDNHDSSLPFHIAEKIQSEIRKSVGID